MSLFGIPIPKSFIVNSISFFIFLITTTTSELLLYLIALSIKFLIATINLVSSTNIFSLGI